jgi:hypothetical protein
MMKSEVVLNSDVIMTSDVTNEEVADLTDTKIPAFFLLSTSGLQQVTKIAK